MKFVPYPDKIVIKPIEQTNIIMGPDDKKLQEKGIVLAVGLAAEGFIKEGETVYFDAWGCSKIIDNEGNELYILTWGGSTIYGKE